MYSDLHAAKESPSSVICVGIARFLYKTKDSDIKARYVCVHSNKTKTWASSRNIQAIIFYFKKINKYMLIHYSLILFLWICWRVMIHLQINESKIIKLLLWYLSLLFLFMCLALIWKTNFIYPLTRHLIYCSWSATIKIFILKITLLTDSLKRIRT